MKQIVKSLVVLFVLGTVVAFAQRRPLAQSGRREQGTKRSAAGFKNRVEITTKGEYREIRSNGIPDHQPGDFPNRHNPNRISEQNYSFRVALEPRAANQLTRLRLGPFGIAVNGIVFDPGAAEFWDDDPESGWQYEAKGGAIDLGLDVNNAHVQPTGAYHYHGVPVALVEKLGAGKRPTLIGYAADGFPVYGPVGFDDQNDIKSKIRKMRPSYRVKPGTRPAGPGGKYNGAFTEDFEYVADAGDLDECNGRYGVTPEYPDGMYHYYITDEYPYIPRMLRGTPDASFRRGPGAGAGPPGRGGPQKGGPRKARPERK